MNPFKITRFASRSALLVTAATLPVPVFADLTWNSSGPNNNWSTADTNWNPGGVVWTQNENAIFDGTSGAAETIDVSTVNTFNDITFGATGFVISSAGAGSLAISNDQSSTVTVTNAADTGTINEVIANNGAGLSSLSKAGAGTLVLGGANTFTGQTTITGGTLKTGAAAALGAGGAGAETLVQSGATLDVNGQALTTTEIIRIAGTGVGGNGALVNTGTAQQNAFNRVVLTANATVGGSTRWDIRAGTTPTLDLAGFTLAKTGANQVSLVGTAVTNGDIAINSGTLSIETTSLVQGTGTITVNNGGILGFYQNTAGNVTRNIVSNNGTITNLGSGGTLNSPISMVGGSTINPGSVSSTLAGNISGSGPLNFTGTGHITLTGTNSYTGGTIITDARVNPSAAAAVPAGTVTVVGDGTVNDGQFFGGAYELPNDFVISGLGGNNIDTVQRGALRLDGTTVNGNVSLTANAGIGANSANIGTVKGSISGNFALTKVDSGTVVFAGTNSYTGSTTVNGGTLTLDYSTQDNSKLSDTAPLIFNGGALSLVEGAHAEKVLSTTLNAGAAASITSPSGLATIDLGAITRNTKATLNISGEFIAKTSSGTVGEAFGSWFTIGGTSLATRNASNEVVAVTPDDVSTIAGPTNTITDGLGQVQLIDGAGTVLLGGTAGDTIDVKTITRSAAGIATVDLAGKTLRVGNPGTIFSGTGSGGITFGTAADSGVLTAGGPSANTPGTLDLRATAGTLRVNSTIADNGTGAVGVNASGTVHLTGTNTYTGGTVVEGFYLGINGDAALGAVPASFSPANVTLNGGTLSSYAGAYGPVTLDANRGITLGASGGTFDSGGTVALTVNGIISGTGSLTTNTGGILVLNGLNTYTGTTNVSTGTTVSFNTVKNVGDVTGSSLGNPATAAAGTIALNNTGKLLYTGTGSTTDRVINLGGTGTTPVIDQSGTGLLKFSSAFTATGAAIKTLTLQGSTAGTGEISGAIVNNSATNTVAVTKAGTGTWALAGANTYTGNTIVNGGTLALGTNTATDYGATGRVRGTITVNTGATLFSQGTNTFGYTVGAKVNQVDIVGGTLTHSGTADTGWGVTYNLTGGTMQTTDVNGRFSFGGPAATPTVVNTLASATTSTIGGRVNLRSDNSNHVTFTVADGAAATDLQVSAVIYGNSVNLTKAGAGLMALGGLNTYNGTTTVNAGTLLVNGTNSGTGAVTVNTGGTLGGIGSVAGALTVNAGATVAPGASAGTLAAGATVIDGSYACELDGDNADKLAVTGNLDIDGATLNVSVLGGGATQSEYIIATYTGTRTGTFIVGTPLPSGYAVSYATAGQIKLVGSASPYSAWAASFGLNPLTDGAPSFVNGGGFQNGTEFILGGSPVSGSNNPKFYSLAADSDDAGTEKELIMTIAVPVGTTVFTAGAPTSTASFAGFGIAVRGSATLDSFLVTVNPVPPVTTGLPALVNPQGGVDYEYRSFSLGGSNGTPGKGFLQVVVTNPAP